MTSTVFMGNAALAETGSWAKASARPLIFLPLAKASGNL
jgi:hypothetical protein